MKYSIIGSGRQGIASAYDIGKFGKAKKIELFDVEINVAIEGAARLNDLLNTNLFTGHQIDVTNFDQVRKILSDTDALLAGVPYKFLPKLTEIAIECRTPMVDYGGNTGNAIRQIELSDQAKDVGITIVPECGMGPGMNITMALLAMEQMDSPKEVSIWDGGLPQDPQPPWNYSIFFNVDGLTNEYDGDAYFLENKQLVRVPCFDRLETLEFSQPLGDLEAAVTSGGLSTMPWTFKGQLTKLENKTLRYPGHWEWMKAFRQLGLFSQEKVKFKGMEIIPREFYHALLEPQIDNGRVEDVCIMRIRCTGSHEDKPRTAWVNSVEYYDKETGFSAMEKWTGWHASILLIAAAHGKLEKGVIPVEKVMSGTEFKKEAELRDYEISIDVT